MAKGEIVSTISNPDYDPKTHCSACEQPLRPEKRAHYVCEETGTKQCSWSCRMTWLEIMAKAKGVN